MGMRAEQSRFAKMLPLLLNYIHFCGYECTFGDTWAFNLWPIIRVLENVLLVLPHAPLVRVIKILKRHAHKKGSCHYLRLAIDINLFKDGVYLMTTEDHRKFGEFWELLGGSWGGRFNDGNHYSIEYHGRR